MPRTERRTFGSQDHNVHPALRACLLHRLVERAEGFERERVPALRLVQGDDPNRPLVGKRDGTFVRHQGRLRIAAPALPRGKAKLGLERRRELRFLGGIAAVAGALLLFVAIDLAAFYAPLYGP